MEQRQLGSLTVSAVAVGCQTFGAPLRPGAVDEVVGAALDAGITFFDTADVEGGGLAEELLGRALRRRQADAVVGTKVGAPGTARPGLSGGHPTWVREAVHASLQRLGRERIDVLQLHHHDPAVPLADTVGAAAGLVREGLVGELGCSGYPADVVAPLAALAAHEGTPLRVCQLRHSLLVRSPALREACARAGVAITPFHPLEGGVLTGKYAPGAPWPAGSRLARATPHRAARWLHPGALEAVAELDRFARAQLGRSVLDLALGWLLSDPLVVAVPVGVTSPAQVRAAVAAAGRRLDATTRQALDDLLAGQGFPLAVEPVTSA